jgi:hypothetical protein
MTTIIDTHLARLRAAEDAEVQVLRAGVAWSPLGAAAIAARGRAAAAASAENAAHVSFREKIAAITRIDKTLGDSLHRLGPDGCTAAGIGEGGGALLAAAVSTAAEVRAARIAAVAARVAASTTQAASAVAWRDCLIAYDALRQVSADVAAGVAAIFGSVVGRSLSVVPPTTPDTVADACRTRLKGIKA